MERDRDVKATHSQTFRRHFQTTYAVLGIPDVVRTTNASIAVLSVSDVRPKKILHETKQYSIVLRVLDVHDLCEHNIATSVSRHKAMLLEAIRCKAENTINHRRNAKPTTQCAQIH